MIRLFVPRRGAARQDVFAAMDVHVSSDNGDFASWLAHRKAKKQQEEKMDIGGARRKEKVAGGRSDS